MKAAIVLLADYQAQNLVRRFVYDLEQKHQVELLASLLPPHVSLKQPFAFEDMEKLETYFDSLAARTAPFLVEMDEMYYAEWNGYGILGINAIETSALRGLHDQLNRELPAVVADPTAPHDGESYRFHMTIELGPVENQSPYRDYYESLAEKTVNLTFTAEHIAMFYYPDRGLPQFITYKILPLRRTS